MLSVVVRGGGGGLGVVVVPADPMTLSQTPRTIVHRT